MSSVDDFNTGAGNDLNVNAYQQQQGSNAQQQSEDYGDKGLDMLEKKEGMNLSRSTNEKITDTAREGFEKVTGKEVPSKWSN
ncbi:hypothetical protein BT96DRAFT_987174 [Gymnopus androsaceus JB14]|uniref:Uncharacterized protein n=1 Tax=Gymnopus androsaceus JB14 TaxID=1447944 RepID=A0A6A4I8I4_9AGAR|nr:hypothetical protein BT96DRAFT_987174 [Gymnopus androsaceus JB14]